MNRFKFNVKMFELAEVVKDISYDCTCIDDLIELTNYWNRINVLYSANEIKLDNCRVELNRLKLENEMLRRTVEDLVNDVEIWHN